MARSLATRPARELTRAQSRVLTSLQIVAAGAFVVAGISKLLGTAEAIAIFDAVGVGQWFRYLVGILEIAGATLIITPTFATAGGVLLGVVMVGAIGAQLFLIGGSPVAPLVLLALVATIAVVRRPAS